MLRFQSAVASLLASALVAPVFLGQTSLATLEDALAGTRRALEVLKGLERRLQEDPAGALALLFSATEPPLEPLDDGAALDRRHDDLRNEVSLLQMELDALLSPELAAVTGARGVTGVAGAIERASVPLGPGTPGVTTGLDDSLRALLASDAPVPPARPALPPRGDTAATPHAAGAYSADPLRHGIACYRAGRHAEALALLEPLEGPAALYWTARTLERLERLDEAIARMERALAAPGDGQGDAPGFERRRAESDLEFMRWKRDFVRGLRPGEEPR